MPQPPTAPALPVIEWPDEPNQRGRAAGTLSAEGRARVDAEYPDAHPVVAQMLLHVADHHGVTFAEAMDDAAKVLARHPHVSLCEALAGEHDCYHEAGEDFDHQH